MARATLPQRENDRRTRERACDPTRREPARYEIAKIRAQQNALPQLGRLGASEITVSGGAQTTIWQSVARMSTRWSTHVQRQSCPTRSAFGVNPGSIGDTHAPVRRSHYFDTTSGLHHAFRAKQAGPYS